MRVGLKSRFFTILCLFCSLSLCAKEVQQEHSPDQKKRSLKALYNSLDPLSLAQYLTFYKLYPNTEEGKKALAHAWSLLHQNKASKSISDLPLNQLDLHPIISLITRQSSDSPIELSPEHLQLIDALSAHFSNRKLKGFQVWTREELLTLPSEEVDLGRGLLLNQFDEGADQKQKIQQYEAALDLMALQIFARLPKHPEDEDKIREINRFIFQEMQFRFPPHSLYAKDIDLYTFLPSVLDSRQGVCLGVSILYLCLAQRLDLPLEIITPPGHIYVRYQGKENITNIETTARGIHLPSETYLGLNTRKLQLRQLKEVIGMAFINQASVYWGRQDFETTVKLYEKALVYLPDDPLIQLFLGLNKLFIGKIEEGTKLLKPLKNFTFDYAISPETIPEDYLEGRADIEGLKTLFLHVDEKRESVLKKQHQLQEALKRCPKFRAALLQLAVTYLQLGRAKEAFQCLHQYHGLDPHDPIVEYYLSIIALERWDHNLAWSFLKRSEVLTQAKDHYPKALKELRHHLRSISPDYSSLEN